MTIIHSPFKQNISWQLLCAALLLLIVQPAAALTLGELTIQSSVGQRFKGFIPYQLAPEDGLAEDCNKLSVIATNNDLPGLGQASLRLESNERSGRILIQSADPLFEPVASFSLKMECKGQQLQRSYTVFLDPAPINPPIITEEASSNKVITKAATRSPRAARTKSTQKQTTEPSNNATNSPKSPETSLTLAPLPATVGQLRIESELSSKNVAPAVLSPEDLKTKIAMMQSLQEQLQSEMIRLQKSMLTLQTLTGGQVVASSTSSAPTAHLNIDQAEETAPPKPSAISPPLPAPTAVQRHPTEATSSNRWIVLVLVLLAAVAGGWIWLRRKQKQNTWEPDSDSSISSIHRSNIKPIPANTQEGHSIFRHSQLFYGGIEVQEEDGSATLERAQLLVAQGETDKAIELLYITINENENETEPWLLLFRVLRQQGMKTEYAQLARRFHDLNGDKDDWALVRNIGYRLDPENPLYSPPENALPHVEAEAKPVNLAQTPAPIDIEHPIEIELPLDITLPAKLAEPENMVVEVEPQRPQDAMLMDFLTAAAENTEQNTYSSDNAPLQIISLDLPPLEFVPPPEEENSPLDLSLITPEEETIEAATVPDNAEEVFEEIDLVELDIELQPPLSFFEPHKK
ncbi:type IV pilus assembly protein FimV [Iodobacter fluviatilis]|uniref:type IV pilus assembly protein FimV n=1 Tax=Iodobacter fluviatilis TaxID=537 RepID=UPI00101F3282|nr:hypothetical protein [Iodobacter fluviatilis]